ncbi:hypothetical protein GGX14DRAFT_399781 [Mycena pura]|uniref:Uncharacterized protein n=1 Tax=Mycena pura TaxID=153505 RepID=A0AAD6YC60_9AGAR|nr:hypothetical protein GGX14DRAFT_399781 [Mycena pura]
MNEDLLAFHVMYDVFYDACLDRAEFRRCKRFKLLQYVTGPPFVSGWVSTWRARGHGAPQRVAGARRSFLNRRRSPINLTRAQSEFNGAGLRLKLRALPGIQPNGSGVSPAVSVAKRLRDRRRAPFDSVGVPVVSDGWREGTVSLSRLPIAGISRLLYALRQLTQIVADARVRNGRCQPVAAAGYVLATVRPRSAAHSHSCRVNTVILWILVGLRCIYFTQDFAANTGDKTLVKCYITSEVLVVYKAKQGCKKLAQVRKGVQSYQTAVPEL